MIILPLIINGIVIAVIGTELIAVSLGVVSADQLLVASTISGLLTLLSFKLSKDALSLINGTPDALEVPAADEA
jgi:hypothetical protein